ncbi:RNA polymerase subunit sigma [Planctomycetales bacterium 10988]|nr:RNA polymerase subunit sigma [Planctomycetales bacterium 10988]
MTLLESKTHISLLAKLQKDDRDERAWREFVDRYGSRIYAWCLRRSLQPADAEDITQQVLVRMTVRLGEFTYDETLSFRGWLRRITENAITDLFRERSRAAQRTGQPSSIEFLDQTEAREDLFERLKDLFDLEVLDEAKSRVQERVNAKRWQAWYMMAVENLPALEVAEKLSMRIATAYTARSQVQELIRQEVQKLDGNNFKTT